jgi:large subunit ribosomal protein L4
MKLSVVDLKGKKVSSVTVDDEVWGAPARVKLVAQAVRVYRSNLRTGAARVKDRSDVNRTGRKMWKQKGTGRARHGDRTAPQFVGGAKAHGPTGRENYKLRLNQKMRQGALRSVLSDMVRGGRVTVIDGLPEIKKTRELVSLRSNLCGAKVRPSAILLVVDKPNADLVRAARNLEGMTLARPEELNALMLLESERLVITKEAVKLIGKLGKLG